MLLRYVFESKEDKQANANDQNKDTDEDGKKTLKGKVIARLQVHFLISI